MTMHTFGTFEAKNKLSHLLDLVEQGDEVTITRNGKPVAKLIAGTDDNEDLRIKKAEEALNWIRKNRHKNDLGDDTVKGLIERGRKN